MRISTLFRTSFGNRLFDANPASLVCKKRDLYRRFSISTGNDEIRLQLQSFAKNPHPKYNISENVLGKVGRNLHLLKNHPLNIIKSRIEEYCSSYASENGMRGFHVFDRMNPIVDTKSCFDDLRVEDDHVSRSSSDTYYLDETTVLRTHTSAHQTQLLRDGLGAFLCCGDVYRRDEIDSSHYPVFHQMEGVRMFEEVELLAMQTQPNGTADATSVNDAIEAELKGLLTGLARHLFGAAAEIRWRDDYFPFTHPSFELDVQFNGKWMEVLGCGVIHPEVLQNAGLIELTGDRTGMLGSKEKGLAPQGWAFGLGLERLAMVLFSIPDIRLFWTEDERFSKQFTAGVIKKFVPYSKYPLCYKDVSFWLPTAAGDGVAMSPGVEDGRSFHSNDVYDLVRDMAGDMVEQVELFDEFHNRKTGRTSHAYRISYRHMGRSLTNEEVDAIQTTVRQRLVTRLGVELR